MGSTKQTKQFYLNNPNIPAKNAELEGTEVEWIERAKEIKKCKNNIFYFAKKILYIYIRVCYTIYVQRSTQEETRNERKTLILYR